jgi:hypothetical protein
MFGLLIAVSLSACSKSDTTSTSGGAAAPAALSWDQGNWNQTNWQ